MRYPVHVVGPSAADNGRLDEAPAIGARQLARRGDRTAPDRCASGRPTNQTAAAGSAFHNATSASHSRPCGACTTRRRQDRRRPIQRRAAPRVHRDRRRRDRHRAPSPPCRRTAGRPAPPRARSAPTPAAPASARSPTTPSAATGSARAGSPSTAAIAQIHDHREQRQRVARRFRLLKQQVKDGVGPNATTSTQHRAWRAPRQAHRARQPPARRPRRRATSPTAR